MKKKLIITVIALATVLSVALSACSKSNYELIKTGFDGAENATCIEKVIEVKRGDVLLSSVEEVYESAEEGYLVTVTTKTLNQIGEGDGMYTETTEGPESTESISIGAFPAERELKNTQYTGEGKDLVLKAQLSSDYLGELGLTSEKCEGSVTFTATLVSGSLTNLDLSYTSSNGNSVFISFTFEY